MRRDGPVRRGALWVLLFALSLIVPSVAASPSADAAEVAHDGIVTSSPPATTPHVLNGIVFSVAEVGDVVVLGGSFTQVQAASGGPVLTRNRLVAFNKHTGQISNDFAPNVNRTVRSVVAAADGQSVYIGGQYSSVDGSPATKVLRLRLSDGGRVTSFSPPVISAVVHDMKLVGERLFIGGTFTRIGNEDRSALAELDPATGALRSGIDFTFEGTHRGGTTEVHKFDVDDSGTTMVVTGNFRTIDGQPRVQVGMIDLTPEGGTLADWHTRRWEPNCYPSFAYYLNDLDFAPDGSYFVLGSMGGYGSGPPTLCDTISRWETSERGENIDPTWVNYAGGDSIYAIEATGDVIYLGGHFRWTNNPFGRDAPGQGAVEREGLAALNPVNGMPLSWDPGRARGRGVFDMLATDDGLWVGSDTDRIARYLYRGRIAFFPLGGGEIPRPEAPSLPVDVIQPSTAVPGLIPFDGDEAGTPVPLDVTGVPWASVRGGFLADDELYLAMSDGTLTRRAFDGEAAGPATTLNLHGLRNFANEMRTMTGLFYTNGRIYYTLAGQSALYMRYFEVESGIVGSQRFTHSTNRAGTNWSQVRGMFLADDGLYWASTGGDLHRLTWVEDIGDGEIAGATEVVSGPGSDGTSWAGSSLIALQALQPPPVNEEPVAEFEADCTWLTCTLDASGSSDPDGEIVEYVWDLAGSPATGEVQTVTFPAAGDHEVSLSVEDDGGAVSSVTRVITVEDPPPLEPSDLSFVDSAVSGTGTAMVHSATVPAGVEVGDLLVATFASNLAMEEVAAPAGWERVAQTSTTSMFASVFTREATESDAGSTVSVSVPQYMRGNVVVAAYRGADLAGATIDLESETTSRAEHTTPTLPAAPEDWVVSYWADKTARTTGWAAPQGVTVRETGAGVGAGHVSWLFADSDGPAVLPSVGGLTATADSSTSHAVMATIALSPATE